jgi:hypothetical protein
MPIEWRSQGDAKDDEAPSVVYDFKQVTPVKALKPSSLDITYFRWFFLLHF